MPTGYRLACAAGAVAASVVFLFVLSVGHASLAPERAGGDFYDAQARALFDGRWDLPPEVLGIEAFEIDGKSYTYFGPVPALLRMPVLAVTDRFDGRLSQPSMAAAFAVAMVATSMLAWRVRLLVRSEPLPGRRELWLTGAVVFFAGAGSVVLYLASQAVVYHEAILWALAFSLCSYLQQIELLRAPSRRALGLAGLFAGLALLTRGSVGVGPVASLALVAGLMILTRLLRRRAAPGRPLGLIEAISPLPPGRYLWGVVIAVALPVAVYGAVNYAKFQHPWQLPLDEQVFSDFDARRQAALAENGGSLFGARFVPTTALQYTRPDAIEIDPLAPWINFSREPTTVVGGVTFDTLDESSSATATMPLLVLLAVLGLLAIVRPPPVSGGDARLLRLPVVGAALGASTVLTIAFVANRYLGDAYPVLLLLGLAGFHAGLRGLTARAPGVRAAAVVAFLGVGLWGVAANTALAIEYQRLIAPVDEADREAFIEWQYDLDGTTRLQPVARGEDDCPDELAGPVAELPERGTVRIQAGCDKAFWTDGFSWIELDPALSEELEGRVSERLDDPG